MPSRSSRLDGWHDVLRAYANQFNITKLRWITSGGATGQESIRNGVEYLRNDCADDDIIIVHDGIRPLVDVSVLSDDRRVPPEGQCGDCDAVQ